NGGVGYVNTSCFDIQVWASAYMASYSCGRELTRISAAYMLDSVNSGQVDDIVVSQWYGSVGFQPRTSSWPGGTAPVRKGTTRGEQPRPTRCRGPDLRSACSSRPALRRDAMGRPSHYHGP